MISGFLRVLFYLAVGPLIGMLVASVVIGAYTYATTGSMQDFVFDSSLFSPGSLIFSYTIGFLPALLTAIIALVLRKPLAGLAYWLWIGLAGAVLSLILAWTLLGPPVVGNPAEPLFFAMLISAGAVAGFACTALFDGLTALFARGR